MAWLHRLLQRCVPEHARCPHPTLLLTHLPCVDRLRLRAALEILVPMVFLALLCLPRYLIADTAHPARFYAPSNLTDLAWSMARG
jgi:hypothetical protein